MKRESDAIAPPEFCGAALAAPLHVTGACQQAIVQGAAPSNEARAARSPVHQATGTEV
jgi:hypothetical protein